MYKHNQSKTKPKISIHMLVSEVVIEKNFFSQKRIAVKKMKMTHLISVYANKVATRTWF